MEQWPILHVSSRNNVTLPSFTIYSITVEEVSPLDALIEGVYWLGICLSSLLTVNVPISFPVFEGCLYSKNSCFFLYFVILFIVIGEGNLSTQNLCVTIDENLDFYQKPCYNKYPYICQIQGGLLFPYSGKTLYCINNFLQSKIAHEIILILFSI